MRFDSKLTEIMYLLEKANRLVGKQKELGCGTIGFSGTKHESELRDLILKAIDKAHQMMIDKLVLKLAEESK